MGKGYSMYIDRFGMPFFVFEADDGTGSGGETPPAGDPAAGTETQTEPDYKAEAEKWKAMSRKHEDRAKANAEAAAELEKFKASQLSDQEKAVNEAKEAGKAEALAAYSQEIAAARIEAALTGVVDNPQEVIGDLNLSKYIGDDGKVDADRVKTLRDRYVKLAAKPKTPANLNQGTVGDPQPGQLTRAELRKMSPEQVSKARTEGRLDSLLQGKI